MVNFKLPLASIATLALLSGTSTVHGQGICQCKCTSDQSSPVYLTSQSACSTFCTGKPCPAGQSNPTGVLKQVASHVIATRYDDVNCKGNPTIMTAIAAAKDCATLLAGSSEGCQSGAFYSCVDGSDRDTAIAKAVKDRSIRVSYGILNNHEDSECFYTTITTNVYFATSECTMSGIRMDSNRFTSCSVESCTSGCSDITPNKCTNRARLGFVKLSLKTPTSAAESVKTTSAIVCSAGLAIIAGVATGLF